MIFAPQIRKNILQVLDEFIIPALQTQAPLQILAEPPFDFSAAQNWTVDEEYLPDQKIEPAQYVWRWPKQGVLASRMLFLGFVYQGVADEKIGLTESVAKTLRDNSQPLPAGMTAIRLPAPAVIAIGSQIPHRSGSSAYHEADVPGGGPSSVLWMQLMGNSVLPHLDSTINPEISSHSLHVQDPLLAQTARIYYDELRYAAGDEHAVAQHLLLSFMCRLRRYLEKNRVGLSNSSWEMPSPQSEIAPTSERTQEICRQVMDYINMNLQNPLTMNLLAQQTNISAAHLSRVFRHSTGQTLMSYVTQQRIEAAKLILTFTPERINDLAHLVGFANASSFCTVFKRSTGRTPRQYSRCHRN